MGKIIKVIIVEDTPVVSLALKKILKTSPDIEVVGSAVNGAEGFKLTQELNPDLVMTDLNMPVMNGLEMTKKIMAEIPKPILVVSDAVGEGHENNVFHLLQAGALDVYPKPKGGVGDFATIGEELIKKVKVLSGVVVFRKRDLSSSLNTQSVTSEPTKSETSSGFVSPSPPTIQYSGSSSSNSSIKLVAIGASTGGPPAFQQILPQFPSNFHLPILCIQHISAGFIENMVSWLGSCTNLKVKLMEDYEQAKPGFIYFPKEDSHMIINRDLTLTSNKNPPHKGHRPAVNETFASIANQLGDKCIAALLTGMGDDGAEGMKAIKMAGGYTIGQDEASSVVYGMPRVAFEIGGCSEQLPLDKIVPRIITKVS
jgi:two-component system chemotaxis response regulator CheB